MDLLEIVGVVVIRASCRYGLSDSIVECPQVWTSCQSCRHNPASQRQGYKGNRTACWPSFSGIPEAVRSLTCYEGIRRGNGGCRGLSGGWNVGMAGFARSRERMGRRFLGDVAECVGYLYGTFRDFRYHEKLCESALENKPPRESCIVMSFALGQKKHARGCMVLSPTLPTKPKISKSCASCNQLLYLARHPNA